MCRHHWMLAIFWYGLDAIARRADVCRSKQIGDLFTYQLERIDIVTCRQTRLHLSIHFLCFVLFYSQTFWNLILCSNPLFSSLISTKSHPLPKKNKVFRPIFLQISNLFCTFVPSKAQKVFFTPPPHALRMRRSTS